MSHTFLDTVPLVKDVCVSDKCSRTNPGPVGFLLLRSELYHASVAPCIYVFVCAVCAVCV